LRRLTAVTRRISIAIPASNEVATIVPCVAALALQPQTLPVGTQYSVHVLANNCRDGTAEIVRDHFGACDWLRIHEVTSTAGDAHAGWARRMALDYAAEDLVAPEDLIFTSDADTVVAPDWGGKTLRYFEESFDAVAGIARIRGSEWNQLTPGQRRRFRQLTKYKALLSYLRRDRAQPGDPWPNHDYEGGASIALTFDMYRKIGGCPALPCGEDRALFEAVRAAGGRVRHALDVRVFTSGRRRGRAKGGAADTIGLWCRHGADDPIYETWRLNAELGYAEKTVENRLTFDKLPGEIARAQALLFASRSAEDLAMSA
jgi:cellulose synthase/poly-beta-1,6-N-acetylglucosamine synthase-like glycosyltransferase